MTDAIAYILRQFRDFYQQFPFLSMEQAIVYFSLYGGVHRALELDFFETEAVSIEKHFIQRFSETEAMVSPAYLLQSPYREILMATARGDGRLSNLFRRAGIGETAGMEVVMLLVRQGILQLEHSRQAPLRAHPKQLLKKTLRSYRIESKARFVMPFYRFWFGFVEPYRETLSKRNGLPFEENLRQHQEGISSLFFEHLSMASLAEYYASRDPLLSQGSYWDHHSEFDLLATTASSQIILGECKYTARPVTKKELTKLKEKAKQSAIPADRYALFSKSGFSNELLRQENEHLLLFDLKRFETLLL